MKQKHNQRGHDLYWLYRLLEDHQKTLLRKINELQKEQKAFHNSELKRINQNENLLKKIMGKIEDLTAKADELDAKVTDLQTSVDAKQEVLVQSFTALNAHISELQAIIDAGTGNTATDAQLQTVLDKMQGTADKIDAAKADLDSTATA